MIIADSEKVEISFPATPRLSNSYNLIPKSVEKAVIITDLEHIFTALVAKYDVPTCADLIQLALNDMIKEMGLEEEQNESKS